MLRQHFPYYLANAAAEGAMTLPVVDKYSGAKATEVALASAAVLDVAIGWAVKAAPAMAAMAGYEKAEVLEHCVKRFTERLERKLEQPKSDDPRELARQRQFEESLKSLNLKKSGGQRSDPIRDKRATNNFADRRMPVPLEYRRAFEDYTKRLARQQKGRSPSSDK